VPDPTDFEKIVQAVDRAFEKPSMKAVQFLALLALVESRGYILFPSSSERTKQMKDPNFIPAEAIQAGTVGQPDRSRQYQHADAKTPDKLLEGVNVAGAIARGTRRDLDQIREELDLKLRNSLIIAASAALLARLPEIFAFVIRILQ
jgi:hypothetical protein